MRRGRVVVMVLASLCTLGVLRLCADLSSSPANAPPTFRGAMPGSSVEVALNTVAQRATPSSEVAAASSTQRAEAAAPGLFGVVLDHEGGRLAGLQVHLLAKGAPERERRIATADAQGRFAFEAAHGSLTVSIWNALPVARDVELAEGERHFVELRAVEPCVLLTGIVRRGGEVVAGREVHVGGRDHLGFVAHKDITDAGGTFRHLLRPGDYELSVSGPVDVTKMHMHGLDVEAEGPGRARSMATVTLTGQQPRQSCDIELPAFSLHAECVDAVDGAPVRTVTVSAWRQGDPAPPRRRLTDEQGLAVVEELESGRWSVTATSTWSLDVAAQQIDIGPANAHATLRFVLPAAGHVELRLEDHAGNLIEPHACSRLVLHIANDGPVAGRQQRGELMRFTGIQFENVPPGRHELRCEDQRDDAGRWLFAPIAPIMPRVVDVRGGESTELSLICQPRPMLTVRTVGAPEPDAAVTVSGPTGTVAPLADEAAATGVWRSPVPPGDYAIVVTRSGMVVHSTQASVVATDVDQVVELH